MKTQEVKKHSKYSASASARWLACPGSIKRIAEAPPQKESAAASEGTKAHELMEFALNSGIKDVVKYFENEEETYPLEMREHVQEFVEYVRGLLDEHDELLVEEKTDCEFIHPEMGGTADVIIVKPFDTLHIIDFKYGAGFVDHVNNTQMLQYAIGAMQKHGDDFIKVKTTIYQPRSGREVRRSHSYSIEQMNDWIETFKHAVAACEVADKEKDLKAGAHCKFCPAAIKCPAITKNTLAKAKLDFAAPLLPQGAELTAKQLKEVLDKAEYLELWISEVKRYAESRIKEGVKISGWGLLPTRPSRKWKDPDFIRSNYTLLTQVAIVTPTEAGKYLKSEGWKKEKILKFLKDNVVAVSSGTKLSKTTNDYAENQLETD